MSDGLSRAQPVGSGTSQTSLGFRTGQVVSTAHRQAELLEPLGMGLGEGPVWDEARQRLLWVDIVDSRLFSLDPSSQELLQVDIGAVPGTVVPSAGDARVVVADALGVAQYDLTAPTRRSIVDVEADELERRANDGACDPWGSLVFGTMRGGGVADDGRLYRLRQGQLELLRRGLTIPNGVAWPSEDVMYHVDSPHRKVDVYRYRPDGPLPDPERHIDLSAHPGVPDGMALDAEGRLWIAFMGAGRVCAITADGRTAEQVDVPCAQTTAVAFGGPRRDVLYVTTGTWSLPRPGTEDGALYAVPDVGPGAPTTPFRNGLGQT
jgi:sugar lactone lactonase YvrE